MDNTMLIKVFVFHEKFVFHLHRKKT